MDESTTPKKGFKGRGRPPKQPMPAPEPVRVEPEADEMVAIMQSISVSEPVPDGPVIGKQLPEGYPNPDPGEVGHLCLDLAKRYNPQWVSLFINPDPHVQRFLPFTGADGKDYQVKVGEWVDVPASIRDSLDMLKYEQIESDINKANPLTQDRVELVKKRVNAFNFSWRPSA